MRYTVAVLVSNKFGVLNRVTSMFRRRQFNITSLNVSETETNKLSRITVTFDSEDDNEQKEQLINQLYKLPDVHSIKEFNEDNSIGCELLLIKLSNETKSRDDIKSAADAFSAVTVDYSKDFLTLRLVDDTRRIDDFINLMREHKILEICRTGNVSLEKGSGAISQTINL